MATQIASHVTLIYPWEAQDPTEIEAWVRDQVAPLQSPFRCRVGPLRRHVTDQGVACVFAVDDIDGGHAHARSLVGSAGFRPGAVEPHVTLVHPRTSRLGDQAWAALSDYAVDVEFCVRSIAVTAWDGKRWPTLATIPLTG